MPIQTIPTKPYMGQEPGTSGLRKKAADFWQPAYLENFVQSLFDVVRADPELGANWGERPLVLGGDGRFYSEVAIQTILKMAAANGVSRVLVGQSGLLSTPAASAVIRRHQAFGGIILSASHNPGGPNGDFGVKFNLANGGPAPVALTDAIYAQTQRITKYYRSDAPDMDLRETGSFQLEAMHVDVIDSVADYLDLMRSIFDFEAIRKLFARDFRIVVDAMHAVGGPYAKAILEKELGAAAGSVIRAQPLPDFGGLHPDPNPVRADHLIELMNDSRGPDFGAALDGDADRNMIVCRGMVISPSDSLAILVEHARLVPAYRDGLVGVARSMPTSTAVDRIAALLGIPCYETPTGWKYFSNLLDDNRITLCGEESYGTGSSHIREKDGLWAVLFWLNILASSTKSVGSVVTQHWRTHGRTFYCRHDYVGLPMAVAAKLIDNLRFFSQHIHGKTFGPRKLILAGEFSYTDPVDGSVASGQGLRFVFDDGARVIFRLSGTSTTDATLRLYLERFEKKPERQSMSTDLALAELAAWADAVAGIRTRTGRKHPDLVC